MSADVVFLLDVDNTLHDTDTFIADLNGTLESRFGAASAKRYWQHYEHLRDTLGYADYLGALQLCRSDAAFGEVGDPALLGMSAYLLDYPFAERLYPGALDVVRRLGEHGPTVILSDGDVVLQPHKVRRAGLWDAVQGRVLIHIHKEEMLDQMQRRYPARHYVMVDDKLRLLNAMKAVMGARLTTVFPRQGHYATDSATLADYPAADVSIDRIAELLQIDIGTLLANPNQSPRP
jgi:FMN phosphatase YigB (HAD superfamily)